MDNHLLSHAIAMPPKLHKGQKRQIRTGISASSHPRNEYGTESERKDCRYSTRRCRRYGMDI